MKVLMVEPMKPPRVAEIPHTLESMQKAVGGYIEVTYPWRDSIALVCDDEVVLKNKPFNRMVSRTTGIFGTFFLCGIDRDDLSDIPDDLIDKYVRLLYEPQILIKTRKGFIVLPLAE